jgi:hypothetical protein
MQAKLVVGQPNDPLEHEADRVADQVMRMPDPTPSIAPASVQLSRKCVACEEEDQKKVQMKPANAAAARREAPPIVRDVLRSPGKPLDAATRAFFEPRFGRDFSAVRVHDNAMAAESARSVGAVAYTVGSHVMFGAGQFQPESQSGQKLMAHELTHFIQQNDGRSAPIIQRQTCGTTVRTCYGTCTAASGRLGTCIWTGITNGCICRDQSSDEPGPSQQVVPTWLAALVGAAVVALIIACFATGVCEFGLVVAGLSAAAAAAVIAFLRSSGIVDSGSTGSTASMDNGSTGSNGSTASMDSGSTGSDDGSTASGDNETAADSAMS